MEAFKKYVLPLLGIASLVVLMGYAGQASNPPCLERVSATSSTTATELWASGNCKMAPRAEVCFYSGSSDPTQKVYLSSFSTTTEDLGWPIFGGQKECHDWDAGAKVWVFHADGETGAEFKTWSIK